VGTQCPYYNDDCPKCIKPLPLEERSWKSEVNILYGQIMRSSPSSQRYVSREEAVGHLQSFIEEVEHSARLSEREKVVKELEHYVKNSFEEYRRNCCSTPNEV
jgi:hypothetical protein